MGKYHPQFIVPDPHSFPPWRTCPWPLPEPPDHLLLVGVQGLVGRKLEHRRDAPALVTAWEGMRGGTARLGSSFRNVVMRRRSSLREGSEEARLDVGHPKIRPPALLDNAWTMFHNFWPDAIPLPPYF